MSPRKLTTENKKEILKLYRETAETTSTLAERYGVSSSTISRFLKTHLSDTEYEDLIQEKRLARTPKGALQLEIEKLQQQESESVSTPIVAVHKQKAETRTLREKPREQATPELTPTREDSGIQPIQPIQPLSLQPPPIPQPQTLVFDGKPEEEEEEEEELERADVLALEEMFGEELSDLDEEDEDLDEDEEDDEDWEEKADIDYAQSISKVTQLEVLPLSAASFPKTCYLVIDRGAELITRPLKEFAELGKIPSEEIQQRTLPVFDNHRVARRFSKRRERVIKVPDGSMIPKTSSYLEAKGITRLLLDGQIYSLSPL